MELGIVAGLEDFFPPMIEKLGRDGFMVELCDGFRSLIDEDKELMTLKSLKRNNISLGLDEIGDDYIVCMLSEDDLDRDGFSQWIGLGISATDESLYYLDNLISLD